ncbi:MAG: hypothetical protein COB66_01600 [Coxiella sp. (in: Bacteria)]|nr:MAG: hypothetical protein COB66_01600 [Coxiella sp. (in: g-proteobacteria)]
MTQRIKDTRKRSIAKALSWRILATLTTILISYVVTHKIGAAITIGSIEVVTKIFLYYAHERMWNVGHSGRDMMQGKRI